MAVDTETKRFSMLNMGSFHGSWIGLSEPDGSNMDSKAERGFLLWHYAGIDADAPPTGISIPVAMHAYRRLFARG